MKKRIQLISGGLVIGVMVVFGYAWIQGDFYSLVFVQRKNACPTLQSPVDVAQVSAILYPGQERGEDYKPHGGFRLDGFKNDEVIVKAPLDAKLVAAGGAIQSDANQYVLVFQANCGLNYSFDHLLTLAPKFQAVLDTLPPLAPGTKKKYSVHARVTVQTDETIATAVGNTLEGQPNTSFDFGVYERWITNEISRDAGWQAKHKGVGRYEDERSLCWLDLLPTGDAETLKALPGGDQTSGKISDYCR